MSTLLKDLPTEDLPRERLISYGVKNLSNEELIAILLGTGTKNISAKTLACNILSNIKSISDLKNINLKQLESIKGMGTAKSTNLLAAIELGMRVCENNIDEKIKIINAKMVYDFFANYIKWDTQENFMVIYLDNKSHYIEHKIIFKGTLNSSLVHPREVIKEALLINSNLIILMHNHPSGDVIPSTEDDNVTSAISQAANLLGIKVIDHLIVSRNTYYSYTEEGKLKYE